jgi:hypothetical protein
MKITFTITFLAVSLTVAAFAVGKTHGRKVTQDEIPPAALLTERGADLAERLKWLRLSEQKLGPKHPSMPEVRSQIESIQQQLKAWAPAPPKASFAANDVKRQIPVMNDEDLRQLVLRLTEEIAELKKRVAELEQPR